MSLTGRPSKALTVVRLAKLTTEMDKEDTSDSEIKFLAELESRRTEIGTGVLET